MKPLTNTRAGKWLLLAVGTVITLTACRKDLGPGEEPRMDQAAKAGIHGHLKQTNTYTSEVVLKWMNMHLRILRTTSPESGRRMGYIGVAFYESVVPGMPSYQSLGGQLNELPALPQTQPGLAYHWPTSANTALATMIRGFYTAAPQSLKVAMDSLETALNAGYATDLPATTMERSKEFGKTVALAIQQWAATDGSTNTYPPYVPLGYGFWAPTPPGYGAAVGPYNGRNRTFVKGSLLGSAPEAPPPYSEDPASAYYKMVQQTYELSKNPTPKQKEMALYYRDIPGLGGGGGHYLSQLAQLLQATHPQLDGAALAYAKAGMTLADALIGCWQEKYKYNQERPIRYIWEVLKHPEWRPAFNTPAHPDFPSGHSTGAGAMEVVFNNLFGSDYQFTSHTYDFLDMPPQVYSSFADMAEQIGLSRVYAGIHYQLSCEAGRTQGNKIAENIERIVRFKKEE